MSILSFTVFPEKFHWLEKTLGTLFATSFLIGLAQFIYVIWGTKVGRFRERERLINLVSLRGDEQVLDVGCGRGLILTAAARRLTTGKALGIDIWNRQDKSGNHPSQPLRNAQIEGVADRVAVQDGDAYNLPLEDGGFDVVLSSLVLHNIEKKEERDKALSEMLRVLKPGGRFTILDFRHVDAYAETLKQRGAFDVQVIGPHFLMFPSVKIVRGRKL